MATSKATDTGEIIKCSICFEIFNKPKYLPCLHTFCETCLGTYITSSLKSTTSDRGSEKGFNCPICRTFVQIPEEISGPEESVVIFPTNHLMVTLIDQSKLNSTKTSCEPCTANGENSTAVSWCNNCNEALCVKCEKVHRVMKVSRKHQIITLDQFKTGSTFLTTLDLCKNHEDKKIKFYCVDHETPCCSTCVTVNHRKCEHVKTLAEAAQGSRKNSNISDLCDTFKEMSDTLESIIIHRNNNLKDIETEQKKLPATISKFRSDINKYLDDLECTLNEELNSLHKECTNEIKDEITDLENSKKIIDNCNSVANACLKSASDIHIFLETNKLRKRQKEQEEILKSKMESVKYLFYELELETKLVDLKDQVKSIGKLVKKTKKTKISGKGKFYSCKNLRDCVATELLKFQVSGSDGLVGGLFLPNGQLLLSDFRNKRMLVFDDKGHCHKMISLLGVSWDVTMIDTQEAVVTLVDIQAIQYINIVQMTTGRQVKVEGLYRGIAYNGTHLIVGCHDNIALIEKNGNIYRRIQIRGSPEYIAGYEDKIFYSCFNKELRCIKTNGNPVFTYSSSDLNSSYGVSCDSEGNIYVGGYHSSNIHQLDPEGKLIKIILSQKEGIQRPRAMKFQPSVDRFLLTFDHSVRIFKLTNACICQEENL